MNCFLLTPFPLTLNKLNFLALNFQNKSVIIVFSVSRLFVFHIYNLEARKFELMEYLKAAQCCPSVGKVPPASPQDGESVTRPTQPLIGLP